MRRMFRRLFNVAAILSLLLCLAAAAAWARSYFRRYDLSADRRELLGTDRHAEFHLTRGSIYLSWSRQETSDAKRARSAGDLSDPIPPPQYRIEWNAWEADEVGAFDPNRGRTTAHWLGGELGRATAETPAHDVLTGSTLFR